MPDPVAVPAQSPTGLAIFEQGLLKVAASLVGGAAAFLSIVPMLPDLPWVKTATSIATAVAALGATLGIASQGIRATGTVAADKVVTVDDALKVINK